MDKITHEVRLLQWQEIIQAQLASGQNKREWCRENGILEKQFFYWQRSLRKGRQWSQTIASLVGYAGNRLKVPRYETKIVAIKSLEIKNKG